MNLFVLSGLSTNIPIGFFLLFFFRARWGSAMCPETHIVVCVESLCFASCAFVASLSGFLSHLITLRWKHWQTLGDWHISHHFPALSLLTLFSFCHCMHLWTAYFNDVHYVPCRSEQFGIRLLIVLFHLCWCGSAWHSLILCDFIIVLHLDLLCKCIFRISRFMYSVFHFPRHK